MTNFANFSIPKTYGAVRQLAFIPKDFDAALKFWTETMGVGPFFHLEHIHLEDVTFRGQPIEYDTTAAIGYWGDIEIELLRQHNSGPSMITEWLESGKDGLHHIRIDVDDLDRAEKEFQAMGGTTLQSANMPGGGQYVMMEMPNSVPIIEMNILHPSFTKLFDYMRRAAREWDGHDGLRPVPDESVWMA